MAENAPFCTENFITFLTPAPRTMPTACTIFVPPLFRWNLRPCKVLHLWGRLHIFLSSLRSLVCVLSAGNQIASPNAVDPLDVHQLIQILYLTVLVTCHVASQILARSVELATMNQLLNYSM